MNSIKIIIDPKVLEISSYNFERNIAALLLCVPKEDLYKLTYIRVVSTLTDKKYGQAHGSYDAYNNSQNIGITICAKNVFPRMPKIIFSIFPMIPRLFLAQVLFHEIGHHYHNMHHGIKRESRESFADNYGKKLFWKLLLSSKMFHFLLVPLRIISRFLKIVREIGGQSK